MNATVSNTHRRKIGRRRKIDWAGIEAGYRAGDPVAALARRFAVAASTIHRRVRGHGWTRDPAPEIDRNKGKIPGKAAAPSRRRDELARLRVLAGRLRERLEKALDENGDDALVLGGRETPAALLLKLCQISEKIVAIERRLAGIEAPTRTQLDEEDRAILDRFKQRHGVV